MILIRDSAAAIRRLPIASRHNDKSPAKWKQSSVTVVSHKFFYGVKNR
jgi:hypothetical protein